MNMPERFPPNAITLRYPELGVGPVSTEPCRSPAYFELEREHIFKQSWLNVGRDEDAAKPGDYFVIDIDVLQSSFIIVRGQDGKMRAFHNACCHRGNKVAAGKGNATDFVCGFHGWAYGTEGQLNHMPDEDQFFNFDKADYALREVNCDVWEGFIFINVAPQPKETLAQWVGEFKDTLAGYPFQNMYRVALYRAKVKANWKIIVDAFQEGYHVAFVHGRSIPNAFTGKQNPFCHISAVDLYKRNRRGSIYANPNHKAAGAEAVAMSCGSTLTQGTSADMSSLPIGVNPERKLEWGFDFNVIFPSFRFDPGQGWYFADNFWPVSVDESIYEIALYMPKPRTASERISQEYTRVLLRDAVSEDLSTLESCQRAIMSGAMPNFVLSDMEVAVRHQYHVVDKMVREGMAK
jgi:phenylpropionate dioxygenase-like ring-hydroxylating dioxygenase large terminal subunit